MQIPKEFDIDSENSEDCYMCPEYAKDIFDYLKNREVRQIVKPLSHWAFFLCFFSELKKSEYVVYLSFLFNFIVRRRSLSSVTTCPRSPASTQR